MIEHPDPSRDPLLKEEGGHRHMEQDWSDDWGRPQVWDFDKLRTSGLLWLINTTVFHPRGYSLTFVYDDEDDAQGWALQGNGQEPWEFANGEIDLDFTNAREFLTGNHGSYPGRSESE